MTTRTVINTVGAVGFLTSEELISLSKQLTYDIKEVKLDYETSEEDCSNT